MVSITPRVSPRNAIPYSEIPTVRGSMWGGSVRVVDPADYGALLDCLLEMAIDTTDGNGVSAEEGVKVTLATEFFNVWAVPHSPAWSKKILPKHVRHITNLIASRPGVQ